MERGDEFAIERSCAARSLRQAS